MTSRCIACDKILDPNDIQIDEEFCNVCWNAYLDSQEDYE